jgi:hypothetical protein
MLLKNHIERLFICLMWINLAFWFSCETVEGETSVGSSWQYIETKHTIVKFTTLKTIKKVDSKIEHPEYNWGLKRLFSSRASKSPTDSVKQKVDAIVERVHEILDMRKRMKKVVIYIYPNNKSFHEASSRMVRTAGTKRRIRAWYIYEQNAIYINADDVHEGIIAHEVAHAIIDNFLAVRPPKATAEIISRYVDKNLFY